MDISWPVLHLHRRLRALTALVAAVRAAKMLDELICPAPRLTAAASAQRRTSRLRGKKVNRTPSKVSTVKLKIHKPWQQA